MLEKIPSNEELESLIGSKRLEIWFALCQMIDNLYDMDTAWNNGGKKWVYEYKYRRGGKTLCALYAKPDCLGLMIIFGKDERQKFENQRDIFSETTQRIYDDATTYHDGKWMMFEPQDTNCFEDYRNMLAIKRKANR